MRAHWNQINRNSAQYTMPHLSSSFHLCCVYVCVENERTEKIPTFVWFVFFSVYFYIFFFLVPRTIIAWAAVPTFAATTNDWKNEHFFCVFTAYSISIDVCLSIREHVLFHLLVYFCRALLLFDCGQHLRHPKAHTHKRALEKRCRVHCLGTLFI